MRIVAICAVVLIHVLAAIVGNEEIRGSRTWWIATILDIGAAWAVPAFVMVSGALLLRPTDESIGSFYRRRLIRIGIPLVFAHVLYLTVRFFGFAGRELTPEVLLIDLLQGGVFTHLYFFWIILGLYAVTPLLRPFVALVTDRTVLIAAIVILAWSVAITIAAEGLRLLGVPITAWQPYPLRLFVPYIGFFVMGFAIRDLVLRTPRLLLTAALAALALAALIIEYASAGTNRAVILLFGGHYLGLPLAVATPSLYALGRTTLERIGLLSNAALNLRVRAIGDLALGVYVLHFAILIVVRRFVPGMSFAQTHDSLPLAILQWAIVVVLSFATAAVMARIPVLRRLIGL